MAGEQLTQLDARYAPRDLATLTELLSVSIQNGDWLLIEDGGVIYKTKAGSLGAFLRAGLLGKPGRLNIDGDSRSQVNGGINANGNGVAALAGSPATNLSHIIASYLGIDSSEIRHRGSSGARLCVPYRNQIVRSGTGAIAGHVYPPHMGVAGQLSRATSKASPGVGLLMYLLNSYGTDATVPTGSGAATARAQAEVAEIHGHRFAISRARWCRFFPSDNSLHATAADLNLVYTQGAGGSNGWAIDTTPPSTPTNGNGDNYLSALKGRKTTVNGNVLTATLPNVIEGPTWVAFAFLATPNAYAQIAAASSGAVSPTTLAVGNALNFPATGSIKVPVTAGGPVDASYSARNTGTGVFTLDAAGITAMSGKTVAATGAEVVMSQGAHFDITGTCPNRVADPTGATTLTTTPRVVTVGGQGCAGDPVHVVIRIPITSADVGKTIIFTAAGALVGEFFEVDSAGIEDVDAPPQLPLNLPAFSYGSPVGPGYLNAGADNHFINSRNGTATHVTTTNNDLAALVAEFDSQVAVVDVASVFSSLYSGKLQAAAGTGNTIHVTPNDATNCVLAKGSQIRIYTEEVILGDLTKNSTTDWQFDNCTRATSADGATTSAATNWGVDTPVFDCRPFCPDRIHPSHEGMVIYAAAYLTTLGTMTPSTRQIATAAGYKGLKRPRMGDGTWIAAATIGGKALSSILASATTVNTIYATRAEVSEPCQVKSLQASTGSGGAVASALLQMGLHLDGPGVPAYPLIDSGDINANLAAGTTITYTLPNPFDLDPGIVWLSAQAHTAVPSLRGIDSVLNNPPIAGSALPVAGYTLANGLSYAPGAPNNVAGSPLQPFPVQSLGGATMVTAPIPFVSAAVQVSARD